MTQKGQIQLGGCIFPVHKATFRFLSDGGYAETDDAPGWDFQIKASAPIEGEDEEVKSLLWDGVRFYSEGDPIPLKDADDLVGVNLNLKDSFDPLTGEVYFTLYTGEHQDVSDLNMTFLRREGANYLIKVEALVHNVFEDPMLFQIDTWIEKLPSQ